MKTKKPDIAPASFMHCANLSDLAKHSVSLPPAEPLIFIPSSTGALTLIHPVRIPDLYLYHPPRQGLPLYRIPPAFSPSIFTLLWLNLQALRGACSVGVAWLLFMACFFPLGMARIFIAVPHFAFSLPLFYLGTHCHCYRFSASTVMCERVRALTPIGGNIKALGWRSFTGIALFVISHEYAPAQKAVTCEGLW